MWRPGALGRGCFAAGAGTVELDDEDSSDPLIWDPNY